MFGYTIHVKEAKRKALVYIGKLLMQGSKICTITIDPYTRSIDKNSDYIFVPVEKEYVEIYLNTFVMSKIANFMKKLKRDRKSIIERKINI